MRNISLIISILLFQVISSFGQAYDLVAQEGEQYQPLTSFTSVTLEKGINTGNFRRWEYEFKFGFDFPFFDESYQSFKLNESGFGTFGNSEEFNLYLFAGDYLAFNPVDTPLFSEVRFQYDLVENKKVLKIEWSYVGLGWEVENDTHLDHYLHYQVWFYEDGVIEFHFGDINLSKSELYVPGKGIIKKDTQTAIGPFIKFKSATTNQSMAIAGNYANPYFSKDPNGGIIHTMPELNWMIQLKYKAVKNEDLISKNNVFIVPSITSDKFTINTNEKIEMVIVSNINGHEIIRTTNKTIHLNKFNNGIYFVSIKTTTGMVTRRVIKI